MDKIFRSLGGAISDGRKVFGTAIVFNSWSEDLGGFRELIKPDALTQEILDKSDIIACLNHNQEDYMMARSRNGQGSLKLMLNEKGLDFEFDAPQTAKGDEVLEYISRGDINACSFCFTLPSEGGCRWYKDENGELRREILKFDRIYDISIVARPAYAETSCSSRDIDDAKEALKEIEQMELENRNEEVVEETPVVEETVEQPIEEVKEETSEEVKEEVNPNTEEEIKEDIVEETTENQDNNRNKNINIKMENFSLLKTIRDVAEGRSFDAATQEIINAGKAEMRANGLATNGQIVLPSESRNYDVATEHDDVVATDYHNILDPLRDKLVFAEAGAHYMNNLKGDVSIPKLTAQNVGWASEVGAAADAATSISSVTMSPKRLTAFVVLSKQFILQDSVSAEEAIRRDLVNAVAEKLEATVLGKVTGVTTQPDGIYDSANAVTVASYGDVCDLEADIEDANVNGNCVYILSNKAKSALRSMIKGTNGTGMVYENGEVDGTKAINTSALKGTDFIYGDFSNLYIGQWGSTEITVDPYTLAANGQVKIVINAYFDAVAVRPEAFVSGNI